MALFHNEELFEKIDDQISDTNEKMKEIRYPQKKRLISQIMMSEKGYRQKDVYMGTTLEAVYYPPSYKKVPECMTEFMKCLSVSGKDIADSLNNIAKNHMDFERIHPFPDGAYHSQRGTYIYRKSRAAI